MRKWSKHQTKPLRRKPEPSKMQKQLRLKANKKPKRRKRRRTRRKRAEMQPLRKMILDLVNKKRKKKK